MIDVVEASIADLRAALEAGSVTAVELVRAYLARLDAYDAPGTATALNAVVVRNPAALAEAEASDARRARGEVRSALDGIPYTAKDSYLVAGLTAAAGSPAFASLVARRDAFTIERLRAAGAICLGLTNMPPMANGGMQRGLYGRAESPYRAEWLTAPFGSGSSNGSGTATAASFAAFGLGEETWSSGRGPASNNALCAYTPSRGVISTRGNWPLVPTMDVVVPHTRTMADLLAVLDVVVADDPDTRGDFWRTQPWIALPAPSQVRPAHYPALAEGAAVHGRRLGIPRMYVNADPEAGSEPASGVEPGIGGPTGRRIDTRPSIVALWERTRAALEDAGAEVVEVDFPVVSNYEGDRDGAPTIATRGLVSPEYLRREIVDLSAWAWEDFLAANGDPALSTLAAVEGSRIFPHPEGALPDRYTGFEDDIATYPDWVRTHPGASWRDMPELADGLRGLERTRLVDLEGWMDGLGLDAVVFPAVADLGPADMDVDPVSADAGWRNGAWVANGNLAIRHLGIPTVTVPMGLLEDIGMPVGLTIAGRSGDDAALLRLGCAVEALCPSRPVPPRTPPLGGTARARDVPAARMHDVTAETRRIVDLVLDYSRERLLAEDTPLDKPLPAAELTRLAGRTISERGLGAERALGVFTHVLAPACITTDDPRYLSFIPTAPTKAAVAFDLVVSASALYGGSWLEGAGAVHAENEVLRWLAGEFGLPDTAGGVFVQGGTLGNLSALVAAREAARTRRTETGGPAPARWAVVCSSQAHSSIASAARVMDVDVVTVPTDADGVLRGDAVAEILADIPDRVFAVVATAGSTNFGIVDDIAGVAAAAHAHGLWLHVDGAYGLAGMLSPLARDLYRGVEQADSVIVDPHKWLFAPFDACALIYRDPEQGRRAHTQHAEYLDTLTDRSEYSPSDYAAHLTRRARGLPLWFSLATHGAAAYREAVSASIALARRIAAEIEQRPDLALVRRPQLGVVVFERSGWTRADYEAWSQRLLDRQHAFVTPSSHEGRPNARFAILNPRTTFDDLVGILDTMR